MLRIRELERVKKELKEIKNNIWNNPSSEEIKNKYIELVELRGKLEDDLKLESVQLLEKYENQTVTKNIINKLINHENIILDNKYNCIFDEAKTTYRFNAKEDVEEKIVVDYYIYC